MSTIDLIILGMVSERPQSAYDIQKDVEEHNLPEWTRISIPSVYKKVLSLQEKGYISGEEVKGGRFAAKSIYHITESGKAYLKELMCEYSMQRPKVLLDFNAVICNLNKLDTDTASELIQNIISGISKSKEYYDNALSEHAHIPLVGRAIMEQQVLVCDALLKWANNFKEEFENEKL
ncbi:MAG: PadR family transcriptional regulator [Candidatus Ornithomonoglobus sp.]